MKERKILTKISIIFGIIDLLLILFGVIFLKPKQVLADTPDSFLMNELYLFNRDTFDLNPNFENGYLMKTTILPSDINDDNTSGFFGWYQNLGYRNLIIPYYGSDNDNVYVVFGVPLNGITATNFQLAYNVSTPTLLDFYLIFTDGTYEEWDTEQNGFGSQFLEVSPSNRAKNCYAFCWEAYSPDYVPSFRFLGVTEGYELGYQNGFSNGKSEGYTLGRNSGYNAGFQDGITNTNEVVYDKILDFNQLIKNGNFENSLNGNFVVESSSTQYTTNIENNILEIRNYTPLYTNNGLQQSINWVTNHKYYLCVTIKNLNDESRNFRFGQPYGVGFSVVLASNEQKKITNIIQPTTITGYGYNVVVISGSINVMYNFSVQNYMLIDLTQMYGEGYEPTLAVCEQIFVNNYYEHTLSSPVDIGYFTGFYEGKNEGIQQGINIGETNQINMNWIQSIFQAMQGFFNIQIFPHVTLGIIVGIPFIISLAWFVIKMFRGGGGGEE